MEILGVTFTLFNVLIALLALFLTSIIYDWLALLHFRRKYKLKGPFPVPLFGNLLEIFFYKLPDLEQKNSKYGATQFGSLGCVGFINIYDTELLKKILIKDHVKFQNRFSLEGLEPPPIDHSLLVLRDAHWKRVRSIVTPTFSVAKLKMMTQEMNHCSDQLVKGLIDKAAAGEPVEAEKHFGCFTMDTIASTAFGLRTNSYNDPDDHFVSSAKKVFGQGVLGNPLVILAFLFPKFALFLTRYFNFSAFWPLDSVRYFSDAIKQIIHKRKETNDTSRTDLLQLMLNAELQNEEDSTEQSQKKLSLDELLAQGFLVFIGGYDTTKTLLTFLSYVLATHPDIQDTLIHEVDECVPKDGDVTYDTVMEMQYLDQVICETLRMYPPLLRMNRTTSNNQDVEIDGHWFPAGVGIQFSIWRMHHDPANYPEPDRFIPERFSPDEKKTRDPFLFIPFGNGPRNCIGMRMATLEAKIATVSILRRLKFIRCPETQDNLELVQETFLRTKQPIKVGVELR